MLRENHFYGHSNIFAKYVGLDSPKPIVGTIQHGWNTLDGFGGTIGRRDDIKRFVWSDIFAQRGHLMGYRNYSVIGSPWRYLCELYDDEIKIADDSDSREGTLFFPFHGWEGSTVVGDYSRLIDQIKAIEGNGPVTVCLYWLEFDDEQIRGLFEEAGFRVVCNGHRDTQRHKGPNSFLVNQLRECLRHKKVASNRLATAVIYGASVGCDVGIYGDPMALKVNDSPVRQLDDRTNLMFPEFESEEIDRSIAQPLAREQLGWDFLMSPTELAHELDWS